MPNLRILADNAIDRAAITASSQASAAMAPANLASDSKSTVWRSAAGTTARLSAAWAAAETIGCVALPFCNLSSSSTMRVRLTNEAPATNVLLYTADFANDVWGKNGTVAVDVTTAPDGTVTADRLSGGTSDGYVVQAYGATTGVAYTASIWLRADSPVTTSLYLYTGAGNTTTASVDVTPTWQRFSVALTVTATSALSFQIGGGGTLANKSIYLWGAQLETGPIATSYYPGAANRPLGYIDSWQSYAYDSGAVLCCPAGAVLPRGFTAAQAANAYAFGGGAFARLWVPPTPAVGLAVDIADPNNLQGYIEASRLVAGNYWSPRVNPDWGSASETPLDFSKNFRKESGDLVSNRSARSRKMNFTLSTMQASDRTALASVIRANGITYPFLVSLFPEDTDPALERDHMIWGNLTALSAMTITCWNGFTKALEFEEK